MSFSMVCTLEPERSPVAATRFARCNRAQALVILAAVGLTTGWLLWVALTKETVPSRWLASHQNAGAADSPETKGDAAFYRAIVDRVHAGEGYYQAVDAELHHWNFQSHSIFNWRLPFYAWFLGHLPSLAWGQVILALCSLATMALGYRAVYQAGGNTRATFLVVLLAGPFMWLFFANISLFTELWSGMLIALSICAYGHDYRRLGFAAGILALFFRELALPYIGITLALACWEKRYREAACWMAGLVVYGLFLGYHAMQVSSRISHTNLANVQSWLQVNGASFVLLTCQINYYLLLAPAWVAALYLPLGLLGLAGWRNTIGIRATLTVAVYVVAFIFVGMKPGNAYWGLMYVPLLPFGLVWAPAALRDLFRAVLRPAAASSSLPVAMAATN